MRWAFFILLLTLNAQAAEEPVPVPCPAWYVRFGRSVKDGVVGTARSARDSAMELKDNVRKEGPLRILVRKRTEAEKAQGYREYFIAPPADAPPPRYLVTKAIAQLRKLNPLRNYTPSRGAVLSLDRLFLRDYTATAGIKGTAVLGAGLGSAIVLTEYLYEKPMAYLEATVPFELAVREGLDTEYTFRGLREQVANGKLTREAAEAEVAKEYRARAKYFDFTRLALEATDAKTMEEVAEKFVPVLNSPELGSAMKDLRYYLSDAFRKNPAFVRPSPPAATNTEVNSEQFARLFALNHAKLFGTFSLPEWLQPGFEVKKLGEGSAARAIYDEVMKDPFRQQLIAFRMAHPDRVSADKLAAWLAEDLEWATRFASLETLGAGMRAAKGSDKVLTLGDRRAKFLADNQLSLP